MARSERAKSSRNSQTGLARLAVSPERPAPPRQRQRATPDEAEFVVCKQTIYGYFRAFLAAEVWESMSGVGGRAPDQVARRRPVQVMLCASACQSPTVRAFSMPRTKKRSKPRLRHWALTHSAVAARSL
jgi:hypothetical protein